MTELDDRALVPFDTVYASVTVDIRAIAARQANKPDQDWLLALVDGFLRERDLWNDREELEGYRQRWMEFRTPFMRLMAGAYLHIGYDLPRSMADHWPGRGQWLPRPDKREARRIYFGLKEVFPDNLRRAARNRGVFSGWTPITARIPPSLLNAAGLWVENLRRGAWDHAEVLADSANREFMELAMAAAMQGALEDAELVRPWTVANLRPFDDFFLSLAPLLALGPLAGSLSVGISVGLTVGALVAMGVSVFFVRRQRAAELAVDQAAFISLWGRLLAEYLAAAVREPEGFLRYRHLRRIDMGLEPPDEPLR